MTKRTLSRPAPAQIDEQLRDLVEEAMAPIRAGYEAMLTQLDQLIAFYAGQRARKEEMLAEMSEVITQLRSARGETLGPPKSN